MITNCYYSTYNRTVVIFVIFLIIYQDYFDLLIIILLQFNYLIILNLTV